MALHYARQDRPAENPRLGIVVSRKVGPAVLRNRIKRWIREVFRKHKASLPSGVDVVLRPQPGLAWPGLEDAERDVLELWRKAGLVDRV